MKRKVTTTRELNRVVTSFTIFKFIKDIVKPYTELKPFDDGQIDKNGKYLVDKRQVTPYYRLIINLKKLLAKIPDPTTKARLKYITSAIILFTEETKAHGADPDIVFNEISEYLLEQGINLDHGLDLLHEEAIVNSVSSGGIYGVRGNPDETVVNQVLYLRNMRKNKNKKPVYFPIGKKNSDGKK